MQPLNDSQQLGLEAITGFISNPTQKFFCLNAPSGYGKSYLIDAIKLDTNKCITVTATTNKAATVLDDAITVYKLLGIVPMWNGELSDKYANAVFGLTITIDEASYICREMFNFIDQYCINCKIIFVGDKYQLKGVGSSFSVFDLGFPTTTLTIPQRQDPNSTLFKLCNHLRQCVIDGVMPVWFKGDDVHFYNDDRYANEITKSFLAGEDCKILAFRNVHVDLYNKAVMDILDKKSMYEKGTLLVSKKYSSGRSKIETLYAEQPITVYSAVADSTEEYGATEHVILVNGLYRVPYGNWYRDLKAKLKAEQKWFELKALDNKYHDFSLGYAMTTFKSQGSTISKVFVDLRDIDTCGELDQKLRQIYVAVSRASTEVHIYV